MKEMSYSKEFISDLNAVVKGQADLLEGLHNSQNNGNSRPAQNLGITSVRRSPTASISETAQQRRIEKDRNLQIDALQKQLDISEMRFSEHLRNKKKLLQDLETKTKEASFLEKQCTELQRENQSLKAQIESTVRVSNLPHSKSRGLRNLTPTRQSPHPFSSMPQDEFMAMKRTLDSSQQEIDHYKKIENQLRLEIKVLRDALDFRSEEIGLSGHADLLAKVARLRGEVTALRQELNFKESHLMNVEENKSELSSKHSNLQKELSSVQQRLAQTEAETYKLRHTDVGHTLRLVEKERDMLQEFIQNDMNKSGHLARQVEQLESDLRMMRKSEAIAKERIQQLNIVAESDAERLLSLEQQLETERTNLKEVNNTNIILRKEKDEATKELQLKLLEFKELNKMYCETYTQLRDRQEEVLTASSNVNTMKSQLQEAKSSVPYLETEIKNLRDRLAFTENELMTTRDTLKVIEPRLDRIEPEWNRLKSEKETWVVDRMDMLSELDRLRPLQRKLDEMTRDLTDPTLSSDYNAQENGSITVSQHHAMWIALPSIRNLNSQLYERIRSLATDLHKQEVHCHELESNLQNTTKELKRVENDNVANLLQLSHSQEHSIQSINELTRRAKSAEEEVMITRAARITLDQVRVALRSFPGNISELYPMDVPKQSLNVEQYVNTLNDSGLAEFVSRVMQYNASSVLALGDCQRRFAQLQTEFTTLSTQNTSLQRDHNNLNTALANSIEKLNEAQLKLQNMETECSDRLESATDLAEQQNALTITLQANIDKCGRDILMKNAQIAFHCNQNEATRVRLLNISREYALMEGLQSPSDSTKIPELIDYIGQALKLPVSFKYPHRSKDDDVFYEYHSSSRHSNDLRDSMLTSSAGQHHHHEDNYMHHPRNTSHFMSPGDFEQTYRRGSGGGSGDGKNRTDSSRKKKKSPQHQHTSSDDYAQSSGNSGGKQRQMRSESASRQRRVDSPHRSGGGGNHATSRSPPLLPVSTPVVSKRTSTPTRGGGGGSANHSHNYNSQHAHQPRVLSNNNNNGASSRMLSLQERLSNASRALASFRE